MNTPNPTDHHGRSPSLPLLRYKKPPNTLEGGFCVDPRARQGQYGGMTLEGFLFWMTMATACVWMFTNRKRRR